MAKDPQHHNSIPGISTGPHRFEMMGWISCAPFERLLNMTIVTAAKGRATLTMPFLKEYAQGAGLMHGGALVSLADTAVVMAIKSIIEPQTHFATTCLQSQFLRPVKKGLITARARITDRDGRTLHGRATVFDDLDQPVLEFTSTFRIAKDARIQGISFAE